jgi:hypothetical protein
MSYSFNGTNIKRDKTHSSNALAKKNRVLTSHNSVIEIILQKLKSKLLPSILRNCYYMFFSFFASSLVCGGHLSPN